MIYNKCQICKQIYFQKNEIISTYIVKSLITNTLYDKGVLYELDTQVKH